ncbi:hypothetical protein GWK47_009478 [Chionoecetes opilio]|uniref:Uncharacterized protein n=1 Tax=Chionoecetes opilio TaxID=41210 RepID=A0A8J4Y7Y6_CHIOP|nr:hypothetical protein GWK47_009478 [Chionoecetes opilio]
MFRELRRKSLQLERGAMEKFRSERRGSLTETEKVSKTEKPSPSTHHHHHHHHAHNHNHHHLHPPHQHHDKSERRGSLVSRWFRHIQEAQEAYTARDGRNRRAHPHTPLHDPDDATPPPADPLRDVDDAVEVDGGEAADTTSEGLADSKTQQGASKSLELSGRTEESAATPATAAQPPASPETLVKKTAEAAGSGGSGGGPSPLAGRSPASGRRLQEVQIIQIVEGPTLIQPSEVKVSQGVVLSAEPVLTPIELLRRKDLKIRQALEEKQQIIANILNIPYEDFESVVDMAGEPAVGNKEPKELVLAAMFQAKCLQESLNEALNLTEGDIVAARANEAKAASAPLYQAPMTKLMNISTTLSQQLSSLLNLVSERDDERERMRKELVASRERLHLMHMRQNSASSQTVATSTQAPSTSSQPTTSSPFTSRPSSFVSVTSSVADHSDTSLQHDTDEDGTEASKGSSSQPEAGAPDTREEPTLEVGHPMSR